MQQGRTYRLRVASNASALAAQMESIQGITTLRILPDGDGLIEFRLTKDSKDEVLDAVVAKVIEGRHGMRELHLKTKSLEEVFFQLTK
jgi:hypothetical protein